MYKSKAQRKRKTRQAKKDKIYEPGIQCPKCYAMLIPSFVRDHVCTVNEHDTPKARARRARRQRIEWSEYYNSL